MYQVPSNLQWKSMWFYAKICCNILGEATNHHPSAVHRGAQVVADGEWLTAQMLQRMMQTCRVTTMEPNLMNRCLPPYCSNIRIFKITFYQKNTIFFYNCHYLDYNYVLFDCNKALLFDQAFGQSWFNSFFFNYYYLIYHNPQFFFRGCRSAHIPVKHHETWDSFFRFLNDY